MPLKKSTKIPIVSSTAQAIAEAINGAIKLLDKWFTTKRFRYSRAANRVAGQYIRRAKKLYNIDDKTLNRYEKKFYHLNQS